MKSRPRRLTSPAIFASLLLSLVALAPAYAAAASAERADAKLDRALEELVEIEGGPPGAAVIVDRGNERHFHRAGFADLSTGRPYRRHDHVRVASVAKAFSGAVALNLVERGALTLDTTVGQLLPELPAAWADVTLRQALAHTAGLPDYIKDEEFREQFGGNTRRYFSPQELIGFVADKPLNFPAGTRYEYSDTDNIVVALMAEAAGGAPYDVLLDRLVSGQLGLRDTSLPETYLMPRPFVRGYAVPPKGAPEDISQRINASAPWASGGVVSTPADLNRFIRGYARGALFSETIRDQQLQFVPDAESGPPGPGENSAGLGIFRYETRCGTVLGHTGNMPGYTTFVAATPNGRRSVSFSVNTQLSPETAPRQFGPLRRTEELAVCAALAGGD
jgi:D-alanyl-D-alanine carboxypeptidase